MEKDEAYWRNKGYMDGKENRWDPPSTAVKDYHTAMGAYKAGYDRGKKERGW